MKRTKRRLPLVLVWALWAVPADIVVGQETRDLQAATTHAHAVALQLLTYQCGSSEDERQFELAVARLDPPPVELFVTVLREGLPREVRAGAEKSAAAAYEERQAWLKTNGRELFGEEVEAISRRDREEYVADTLDRLERLYRDNAVRALGVVGGHDAAAAVREAAERDPDLAELARKALESIERRGAGSGG